MASFSGPNTVDDGLVLSLDAANVKAYFGSWSPALSNGANAFDGDLSTVAGALGGNFGPYTYTIANSPKIISARMYVNLGASSQQVGSTTNVIKADGTDVTAKAKSANAYSNVGHQWIDVTSEVGDTWSTFQITGISGSTNPNIAAIEINGKIIVGNYSGTTWVDLSTNGNNGSISSATHTSGSDGYFNFDGPTSSSTRVTIDTSGYGSGSFSISMWFNADTLTTYHMLLGASGYGGSGNGIGHYLQNNKVRTWVQEGTGSAVNIWESSNIISTGTWYNLVLMREYATAWRWYLNGDLSNTNTTQYRTTDWTSSESYIGDHYNTNVYHFDGKISNVSIYNKALTAAEVTQNFNALRGRYGI